MDLKEIHIRIRSNLQRKLTNSFVGIQPELIDLYLTSEALKFFKEEKTNVFKNGRQSILNPQGSSFDDFVENLHYLDTHVEARKLVLTVQDNVCFGQLPKDFYSYISASCKVINGCNDISSKVIDNVFIKSFVEFDISVGSGNTNFDNYILTLKDSTLTNPDLVIFSVSNLNLTDVKENENFYIKKLIFDKVTTNFVNIYDGYYNGVYYNNKLVLEYEGLSYDTLSITNNAFSSNLSLKDSTVNSKIENSSDLSVNEDVKLRLVSSKNYDNLKESNFVQTKAKSPVGLIKKKSIYIDCKNTYIVPEIILHYIRYPRLIDYRTNSNPDFNVSFIEELIDKTTEFIAGIYGSRLFQSMTQVLNK